MNKKIIGKVSEAERDEIKSLYERKNGLTELFKVISSEKPLNDQIYDKVVKDMGEVSNKFNDWWSANQKKYNWEDIPGYKWEIAFDTCEIFIVG